MCTFKKIKIWGGQNSFFLLIEQKFGDERVPILVAWILKQTRIRTAIAVTFTEAHAPLPIYSKTEPFCSDQTQLQGHQKTLPCCSCQHPPGARKKLAPTSSSTLAAVYFRQAEGTTNYEALLVEYESLPMEYESLPMEYESLLVEYESLLVEYESLPMEYESLLVEYESLLVEYEALLVEYESLPMEYESLLVEYESLLVGYELLLSVRGRKKNRKNNRKLEYWNSKH